MHLIVDLPNGAIVSRATDGTIFVTGAQGARQVDNANPVGLLPLLELGPGAVPAAAADALPVSELLSLALSWGTTADHWPRLAVQWLATTGVPVQVEAALAAFAYSDRGSQETRHAARRLLHEAR